MLLCSYLSSPPFIDASILLFLFFVLKLSLALINFHLVPAVLIWMFFHYLLPVMQKHTGINAEYDYCRVTVTRLSSSSPVCVCVSLWCQREAALGQQATDLHAAPHRGHGEGKTDCAECVYTWKEAHDRNLYHGWFTLDHSSVKNV